MKIIKAESVQEILFCDQTKHGWAICTWIQDEVSPLGSFERLASVIQSYNSEFNILHVPVHDIYIYMHQQEKYKHTMWLAINTYYAFMQPESRTYRTLSSINLGQFGNLSKLATSRMVNRTAYNQFLCLLGNRHRHLQKMHDHGIPHQYYDVYLHIKWLFYNVGFTN